MKKHMLLMVPFYPSLIFSLFCSFQDLDECADKDACDANEKCVNTIGSYFCSCAPGYAGEARKCQGNLSPDNDIFTD